MKNLSKILCATSLSLGILAGTASAGSNQKNYVIEEYAGDSKVLRNPSRYEMRAGSKEEKLYSLEPVPVSERDPYSPPEQFKLKNRNGKMVHLIEGGTVVGFFGESTDYNVFDWREMHDQWFSKIPQKRQNILPFLPEVQKEYRFHDGFGTDALKIRETGESAFGLGMEVPRITRDYDIIRADTDETIGTIKEGFNPKNLKNLFFGPQEQVYRVSLNRNEATRKMLRDITIAAGIIDGIEDSK